MPKVGMKEVRQQQVIEATMRCIVKKGLSQMSMKDIAVEAGVSTGIIYHYFKNKEDLLLQVLKESFRKSHERVMDTVEPLRQSREKLLKHLENINAVPKENPDFYIVLLNYLGQAPHNPEIHKIVTKFLSNLTSYANRYLSTDLTGGTFADVRLWHLPTILLALGMGLGIMWTLDRNSFSIEEMDVSLKDLISRYID
ncbi:TetR/AcrR family transcriptional regulator [Effusibacillus dendaii]|uniref:HTH tetR-type domain-containing protein n=1 Tax=Effusibacillus dendaii TaxID=2743772 RepID=A0A7I8DJF0_9BACL|nr:TetR/AcrR family transcriptional regulator [Effusibacillus dendaii]BCJ87971.1 hypothetical protein skT53_29560 [Effusibacillus dendaii]